MSEMSFEGGDVGGDLGSDIGGGFADTGGDFGDVGDLADGGDYGDLDADFSEPALDADELGDPLEADLVAGDGVDLTDHLAPEDDLGDLTRDVPEDDLSDLTRDSTEDDLSDLTRDAPEDDLGDLTRDTPEDDLSDFTRDAPEDDLSDFTRDAPEEDLSDLTGDAPEDDLGDLTRDTPEDDLSDFTREAPEDDKGEPAESIDKLPSDEVVEEYTDPRHQKGAELEEGYHKYLEGKENITILSRHDSVTTPGFDDVYYDEATGRVTVVEDKNLGTEENPGYISEVSAWREDHWNNNVDKTLEAIDNSDLSEDMKDKMTSALLNGDIDRELVIGANTRVSDAKLEQNQVGNLVRFDPASGEILRVP